MIWTRMLAVVAVLSLVVMGRKATASEIDCGEVLRIGLFDQFEIKSERDLFSQVMTALETVIHSTAWKSAEAGGSVQIPIPKFPINIRGKTETKRFEEIYDRYKRDGYEGLTSSDKTSIYSRVASAHAPLAIRAWQECATRLQRRTGLDVDSELTTDTVQLEMIWSESPDGRPAELPVISTIDVVNARVVGELPKLGTKIDKRMVIVAQPVSKSSDVIFIVRTDREECPVIITPQEWPLDPVIAGQLEEERLAKQAEAERAAVAARAAEEAAFQNAHAAWKRRIEEYRQVALGSLLRMPRAGSEHWSIRPLDSGERIIAVEGYTGTNCDRFRFKVRGADGSEFWTDWLNDGTGGGNHKLVYLDSDEYLDGYRLKHGDNTDSIWFRTNKGRLIQIGGNGGGIDLGWFRMKGHELVSLECDAGRNVDSIRGGFRKVFDANDLREPKRSDYENS